MKSFASKPPWRRVEPDPDRSPPAFLASEERQLCYWLGRDAYQGRGEIVDLGSFLGGSASAMASGLRDNRKLIDAEKRARVHCFDLFRFRAYLAKHFDGELKRDDSFLNRFHDNITGLEKFVVLHPGPVEDRAWRLGPIEIAFVDCAKTFASNAAIVKTFFPALVPEALVVQQDYGYASRLIWLHATMEHFAEHFEHVGSMAKGGGASVAFRLIKPISGEQAAACIKELATRTEALAEAAAHRMRHLDREHRAITGSLEAFRRDPLPIP